MGVLVTESGDRALPRMMTQSVRPTMPKLRGRILRAEDTYPADSAAKRVSERCLVHHWSWWAKGYELPSDHHESIELDAFINHSRWLVQCPWCNSAQVVSPVDPQFFCIQCSNEQADYKWVAIKFPADDEVTKIEEALSLRAHINRNWQIGETSDTLNRENLLMDANTAEARAQLVKGHTAGLPYPGDWDLDKLHSSTLRPQAPPPAGWGR